MIHKQQKIGSITCDIVQLGKGSVSLQPAFLDKEQFPVLMMKSSDKGYEVGHQNQEYKGKSSEEFKPEITMVFENSKCIDVLIASLEDCKKYYCECGMSKSYENEFCVLCKIQEGTDCKNKHF